ncbi:MAG: ATP-binding cassette domain-containing protein, partial [Ignavibacteria bacterium]
MKPIKFEKVSHNYSNIKVLHDLSFEIDENIITAIIGKSGSGKSTLLQIINGLIVPSNGAVYVFGKILNYNKINEIRLNIGYSVQG